MMRHSMAHQKNQVTSIVLLCMVWGPALAATVGRTVSMACTAHQSLFSIWANQNIMIGGEALVCMVVLWVPDSLTLKVIRQLSSMGLDTR